MLVLQCGEQYTVAWVEDGKIDNPERQPAKAAGGHARAAALSPERRSEIAKNATDKRWRT